MASSGRPRKITGLRNKFRRLGMYGMSDIKDKDRTADALEAKQPWKTPDFEVLSVQQTNNNGLVAPGDGTFSPSPSGS